MVKMGFTDRPLFLKRLQLQLHARHVPTTKQQQGPATGRPGKMLSVPALPQCLSSRASLGRRTRPRVCARAGFRCCRGRHDSKHLVRIPARLRGQCDGSRGATEQVVRRRIGVAHPHCRSHPRAAHTFLRRASYHHRPGQDECGGV